MYVSLAKFVTGDLGAVDQSLHRSFSSTLFYQDRSEAPYPSLGRFQAQFGHISILFYSFHALLWLVFVQSLWVGPLRAYISVWNLKMKQDEIRDSNLSIINEIPTILEGPVLLHELVSPSSSALALDFLDHGSTRQQFSYEILHSLSNSFAKQITHTLAGIENASAVIPILLPQSPELYIAILAILKAGKAFCPLNLDSPTERIEFMLKDVSANIIISSTSHAENVGSTKDLTILLVDQVLDQSMSVDFTPARQIRTSDLAYVLYTSGSTGLPKAVGVSHRAVTQSLLAHSRHIPDFSRFLQFAAPTFDVSIFEIFFPWHKGRTLVGCDRTRMLDDLPGTIQLLNVDAVELTPTVVTNLLGDRTNVPGLRLLLTIGEMLTDSIVTEYGGTATRESMLWGMYGPTEAAIHCTLQPRFLASSSASTIGFPLDTVSAFIVVPNLDKTAAPFEIVPIGEEGELVLGGPQIADGYLNRPEITAKSFIHHPEYGYLYRTGDRARLRDDRSLECLGRIVSGQVKVRGQRVELGEIEQTILKVDGCRVAVAMIIDDTLVAFCATGSQQISETDILRVCKKWLPGYMTPSEALTVQLMPQSSSGKVDRLALEALYRSRLQSKESLNGDDAGFSSGIIGVLERYLKRKLTPSCKLAHVGLDSLLAIRIASALRSNGFHINATDILAAITVEDLMMMVSENSAQTELMDRADETLLHTEFNIDIPELRQWRSNITRAQRCTPLQEAMLTETTVNSQAYCNWVEVELSQAYSFDEIRDALFNLAQLNEIIRSGFLSTSSGIGAFIQLVWNALEPTQIRQVNEFSRTYTLDSFELFLRPLAVQIQTSAVNPRLLFQIHHALYDGWSFDLLLEDLSCLLRGHRCKQRPQFREVTHYHCQLSEKEKEIDVQYWAETLLDRAEVPLPNYNGQIIASSSICSWTCQSGVDYSSLLSRARELNISPQAFFQVATAFVISLYTNSTDITLGNVTSGRTIPVVGVEEIVGPCIATVPFRLRFGDYSTVRDVLLAAQRMNREGMQHCNLPLREIAKAANALAQTRLFDVLFVWQQPLNTISSTAYIVDSADQLEFKITLEFEPTPECILFRATYDSSVIPELQIKYMSQQIDEMVMQFLKDFNQPTLDIAKGFTPSSLAIANSELRQDMIQHGLSSSVEKWASVMPEQEAIVFGHIVEGSIGVKETITYSTLNRRSNQLGHVLREWGVGPGCLVAVIMDKSIELYIAILAVLKTGSGYLPLVPDLPIERVRGIFNDARIEVCISESSCSEALRSNVSASILDLDKTHLAGYSEKNLETPYKGDDLAYAVFTSGSTGTPKGVLVTQDNLMSNLIFLSSIYPYSTDSRLLQACSQAFDVSVFEIFFAWHVGMTLCTASRDVLFQDLEAAIRKLGVTHLSLTPTVAALIEPDNVPKVEFLVTAGEAVTEQVRRKWAGRGLWQGDYSVP